MILVQNTKKTEVWQMGLIEFLKKEEDIINKEDKKQRIMLTELVGGLSLQFMDFLKQIQTLPNRGRVRRV